MRVFRSGLFSTAVAALCFVVTSAAEAQLTRTWVSATGNDINPCSRDMPCLTFNGAHGATNAGGAINVIDPGGYGSVTVTKSITIDGRGTMATIVVTGANGVVVNAGASDVVTLRNLEINGAGVGMSGIRIMQAREVHVENCTISGFTGRGIIDERTAGLLFVSNTTVSSNAQTGIVMVPSGALTGTLHGQFTHVRMERNGSAGLALTGGAKATVSHSVASGNVNSGFYADGVGGASELNLEHSTTTANTEGVTSRTGATVRMTDTTVTANANGLNVVAGTLLSYGNNRIDGNGINNGPPTGTLTEQ